MDFNDWNLLMILQRHYHVGLLILVNPLHVLFGLQVRRLYVLYYQSWGLFANSSWYFGFLTAFPSFICRFCLSWLFLVLGRHFVLSELLHRAAILVLLLRNCRLFQFLTTFPLIANIWIVLLFRLVVVSALDLFRDDVWRNWAHAFFEFSISYLLVAVYVETP